MSYTAPTLSISVASQSQIQEGIDLLTALLSVEVVDVAPAAADAPNDEAELSPQQKAARTRAKNKAAREAAAAKEMAAVDAITQTQHATPPPATPPAPTTPSAPAPVVPTAPAPVASNLVDYSTLSAEASAKHQQLSMSGRGQELIDLLGQYGVQRLDALPQEQWGNFITAVRAL